MKKGIFLALVVALGFGIYVYAQDKTKSVMPVAKEVPKAMARESSIEYCVRLGPSVRMGRFIRSSRPKVAELIIVLVVTPSFFHRKKSLILNAGGRHFMIHLRPKT